MSETNEANKDKIPNEEPKSLAELIKYDWRDPSKPRNPEDDVIVDGWRRRADGTFEKIEDTEAQQ
ncbi:hypothetical protein H6G80_12225 [Nostoc sp. FACHB-87]|uniref:hypothetical protein n=1 Tax=Nostocaceae TaxID=1162 RepID=UPI001686C8D4|nr:MULTISPECIES: hypothetical protein [Nostocaceae]MBD2454847.1 hypothetical protein [Nostoc sp. FACHB-87]MBD2476695.1 hypothetical protein [Anabaena sp. FACHB-83]